METTFENNNDYSKAQVIKEKPVFIKNGRELIRIRPEKIVCIKASDNICEIYIDGKKSPELVSRTFSSLMATPIGKHLIQIKRGASVNLDYVKKVEGTEITLTANINKPISLNISQNHIQDFVNRIEVV